MIVRKILLVAGAVALMSTPTWALASKGASNPGAVHKQSATPNNKDNQDNHGDSHHKGSGNHSQGHHPGNSHKCVPHKVGYVASGAFVSQTLTKNEDGTYSGELVVEVTHTNHHAAADRGKTVTYTLTNVHLTFGLVDTNNDGSVSLDDLMKGDRVHLNGKITALAKKCAPGEFTATKTIRRIVFHAPTGAVSDKG